VAFLLMTSLAEQSLPHICRVSRLIPGIFAPALLRRPPARCAPARTIPGIDRHQLTGRRSSGRFPESVTFATRFET